MLGLSLALTLGNPNLAGVLTIANILGPKLRLDFNPVGKPSSITAVSGLASVVIEQAHNSPFSQTTAADRPTIDPGNFIRPDGVTEYLALTTLQSQFLPTGGNFSYFGIIDQNIPGVTAGNNTHFAFGGNLGTGFQVGRNQVGTDSVLKTIISGVTVIGNATEVFQGLCVIEVAVGATSAELFVNGVSVGSASGLAPSFVLSRTRIGCNMLTTAAAFSPASHAREFVCDTPTTGQRTQIYALLNRMKADILDGFDDSFGEEFA